MSRRPRGERPLDAVGYTWSSILLYVATCAAAVAAFLLGLGVGLSIAVFVGGFILSSVVAVRTDRRALLRRVETHLAAGRHSMARRLAKQAGERYPWDERLQALARLAETAGSPDEAPPGPEPESPESPPAPESLPAPAPPPAPELPPVPAPPVLSTGGLLVAGLLVPAFLPLAGALPALALLAISVLLLRRREPLPWDRRAAGVGLALSVLALAAHGAGLYGWLGVDVPRGDAPELDVAAVTLRFRVALIAVLVLSVILHECAHGVAARVSGDPTALDAGRISANPLRHVDPIGTVVLPVILSLTTSVVFGWAKPVPVRPERFRHPRRGRLFVSLAGVLTNFLLAFACAGLLLVTACAVHLLHPGARIPGFAEPFAAVRASPPLALFVEALKAGVLVNLVLGSLNLLPLPPLDGSHALTAVLPPALARGLRRLAPLGLVLLLVLLFSGRLDILFAPGLLAGVGLIAAPGLLFGI